MELYSSDAFVRDIVNAISRSEGKPLNIGGNGQQGIQRNYAFQLISEAKRAVEGNAGLKGCGSVSNDAVSRSDAIQNLMRTLEREEAAAKQRLRVTKKVATPAGVAKAARRRTTGHTDTTS